MEGKKQNLLAVKFVMENQTDPDNNTSANDEDSGDYLKKMFNGFSISNHHHNIERQMALEDVEAIGIACISLAPKRVVDDSKAFLYFIYKINNIYSFYHMIKYFFLRLSSLPLSLLNAPSSLNQNLGFVN